MGDTGDDFRVMREHTRQRHKQMHDENRRLLLASGIPFRDKGEALLFRNPGSPLADFYPSTGRWTVIGRMGRFDGLSVLRGGASAFLAWYRGHSRKGGDE